MKHTAFKEHLKKSAERVSKWPDWKRDSMGQWKDAEKKKLKKS